MSGAKIGSARQGIEFDRKILTSNDICNTKTNFAKSNKFDILIIGARGKKYSKSLFLGSVSNGIVDSCPVPVLMVR
jgi:nucleotide-binding universal stress UspA family protein